MLLLFVMLVVIGSVAGQENVVQVAGLQGLTTLSSCIGKISGMSAFITGLRKSFSIWAVCNFAQSALFAFISEY